MRKTLTMCVAGPTATTLPDWLQWERLVGQIASEHGMALTHASVVSGVTRYKKLSSYRPLNPAGRATIHRYSLASVAKDFVTIIQDARLYAQRAHDGLYLTIAFGNARPEEVLRRNVKRLKQCVSRVDGLAAFVLPATELAANYAHGMNDVRECSKAKILTYAPGGFLPR